MKSLVRIGIVSLAAAVVLFAAFHHMRAQGERSPNAVNGPQASSESTPEFVTKTSVAHTLLTTYITQNLGFPPTAETGGSYLAIDGLTTFKCPWPGCTLEIEQSVEVGGVSYADNPWSLSVVVDGSVLGYSPEIGLVPSDGSYVTGNVNQSAPLTPGKHTVQSLVLSNDGLNLGSSHINYRVYVP
jgi:hypothetical protein